MREDSFWRKVLTPGTPHCALACTAVGIVTALLLLWAGVWRTLLVAACVAVGAFLGGVRDKKAWIRGIADKFSNR